MISRPNGRVQVSCAPRPEVVQSVTQPSSLNSTIDPQADEQARHDQAGDGDVEDHRRSQKAAAKARPAATDSTTVSTDDHGAKADRTLESAGDVARARVRVDQFVEPVRRDTAQREGQSAVLALERQDVDDEHRAVEEDHEQDEERGEEPERPRPRSVHTVAPCIACDPPLRWRVACARRRPAGWPRP